MVTHYMRRCADCGKWEIEKSVPSTNPIREHMTVQSKVKDITHKSELKPNSMVMVYTDWCGYCKQAKPEYSQMSYPGVDIVLVNAERLPEVAEKAGARGYPHFAYFDGRNFHTFNGPRTNEARVEFLNKMTKM